MNVQLYDQKLEQILTNAKKQAFSGEVSTALFYLEQAREYAGKVGVPLSVATLQEVEQTAYRSGIKASLGNAKKQASSGEVSRALFYLEQAREYAGKVGVPLPVVTLQEVEQTAYRSGIEASLGKAKKQASSGEVSGALFYLEQARGYAGKVGVPLPVVTLQTVEQTAYRSGIEASLGNAKKQASSGEVSTARFYLEQAREYAGKVGLDITDRLQEIEVTIRK